MLRTAYFKIALAVFLLMQCLSIDAAENLKWSVDAESDNQSGTETYEAPRLSLRSGWTNDAPWQYASTNQLDGVGGADIEIVGAVAHIAQAEVKFGKKTWSGQIDDLIAGRADMAFGAFLPEAGDQRFFYSKPYRQARVALFVRKGDEERADLHDLPKLMRQDGRFRLGMVHGRSFQDPHLYAAFETAGRERRLVLAQDDEENLRNLAEGRIDGFVAERIGVYATALRMGLNEKIHGSALPGLSGVHLIFSRTTVSPGTVARFDAAITKLQEAGDIRNIIHKSVFSVAMDDFFHTPFFHILEVIGTIAFAISGVLIAHRERFSIVGALVLSALPALGGGALRDILFDRHPIGVLASPFGPSLVILTVVGGLAVIRIVKLLQHRRYWFDAGFHVPAFVNIKNIYELSDAVGLGAFTVSGAAVAVAVGADPLWLWVPISAVLTAAGGGILRDIVRQSGRVETLKTDFYAEVPIIWGALFTVFLIYQPTILEPQYIVAAMIVMLFGAILTRIGAMWVGLRGIRFW